MPHALRVALAALGRLRLLVRIVPALVRPLVLFGAIVLLRRRFGPEPTGLATSTEAGPPVVAHRREAAARHDAHRLTRRDRWRRATVRRLGLGPVMTRDAIVRGILVHPRTLPAGVATLVVAAALVGVAPAATGRSPSSAVLGTTGGPRIVAFGGALRGGAPNAAIGDTGPVDVAAERDAFEADLATADRALATGAEAQVRQQQSLSLTLGTEPVDLAFDAVGPFGTDGLRYALGPVVPDGRLLLRSYATRAGDTLASIGKRFHLRAETIWWANHLRSVSNIPAGTVLVIPPVDGLVVVVKEGDTLAAIAERTKVSAATIVAENGLPTDELVTGQTLIVPGARGAALPKPPVPKPAPTPVAKPAPKPAPKPTVSVSRGWVFPVVGGGAYISQYFHASHPAIDIAADYGTPVRAAHAGTVIFAGWKSNGGGWQVWISHGGGYFTTYNHMSSLTVRTGQSVGAGQQVGRVGQSGWATGPHCHFEVWRGPIWDGGVRVNPLNYV